MDHYQVLVPDVAAAAKFYLDLGFRVSDYTVFGEDRIVAIFMYRKDNPHDMVLLQRSGPRFHHYGYIVQEMHHVVRALDIAGNLGFGDSLEHGPGRHGSGHSYYVYLRDPDGHRVELLLPATQIIDIDDEPMRYDVTPGRNTNLWGLPPPRIVVRGNDAARRRAHRQARGRGRAVLAGKISVCKEAAGCRGGISRRSSRNSCRSMPLLFFMAPMIAVRIAPPTPPLNRVRDDAADAEIAGLRRRHDSGQQQGNDLTEHAAADETGNDVSDHAKIEFRGSFSCGDPAESTCDQIDNNLFH